MDFLFKKKHKTQICLKIDEVILLPFYYYLFVLNKKNPETICFLFYCQGYKMVLGAIKKCNQNLSKGAIKGVQLVHYCLLNNFD